jgi:hypothetical protein
VNFDAIFSVAYFYGRHWGYHMELASRTPANAKLVYGVKLYDHYKQIHLQ